MYKLPVISVSFKLNGLSTYFFQFPVAQDFNPINSSPQEQIDATVLYIP